jgi:hypothetical protein
MLSTIILTTKCFDGAFDRFNIQSVIKDVNVNCEAESPVLGQLRRLVGCPGAFPFRNDVRFVFGAVSRSRVRE